MREVVICLGPLCDWRQADDDFGASLERQPRQPTSFTPHARGRCCEPQKEQIHDEHQYAMADANRERKLTTSAPVVLDALTRCRRCMVQHTRAAVGGVEALETGSPAAPRPINGRPPPPRQAFRHIPRPLRAHPIIPSGSELHIMPDRMHINTTSVFELGRSCGEMFRFDLARLRPCALVPYTPRGVCVVCVHAVDSPFIIGSSGKPSHHGSCVGCGSLQSSILRPAIEATAHVRAAKGSFLHDAYHLRHWLEAPTLTAIAHSLAA
ncbi:hypothetical protein QBC46DRAFT_346787 [Diplogelasinospora grovesii]|uniref:Uncharacterized protein n=1 Tax=Diplogelasinospora grovesii TaxID=303347 RepID=A0AAN6MXG2_9PEZI|nr:hypothetical protein QBC46DRAFT_346787 [Diplogelasinospora grovesii]